MIQPVTQIRARHWQAKLGTYGEIVQDLDDITQAISIILTTAKGEVPHRPEFGADLWRHLDQPLPLVRATLEREVFDALSENEPRITVDSVDAEPIDPAQGRVRLRVHWRLNDSFSLQTSEVTL